MTPEILERLNSLAMTGLIGFFFLSIAYKLQFFSWKREGEFAKLDFNDVLGAFFSFITIQLVLSPVIMMAYFYFIEKKSLLEMQNVNHQTEAWLGIFNNVLLFLGFGLYCYTKRGKVKTFFGKKLRWSDFFVGVLTWLISMPVASFLAEIIDLFLGLLREKPVDQAAVQHLKQTAMYPFLFAATALMVITVIPLMEELLFRGFLQTWLRQRIGVAWAIFTTSVIFAGFHFSINQSYDNFLILTILFTVSCFMGFVYERQKSLLASIGLHATFNAVTTFSIFFSKS